MSFGNSVGNARWTQGEEGEETIEIRIPIVLPPAVRPRDLTVEMKESTVLCVRHKEMSILQWRLYAPVAVEVEWRVESEGELVVDMAKKSPSVWPCLLDFPMRSDNELLMQVPELDALFREQHPILPPLGKEGEAEAEAAKEKSDLDDGEVEDLDKLLEEAVEEVVEPAANGADEDSSNAREFIEAELKNYHEEIEEIQKKLVAAKNTLESGAEEEAAKVASEQCAVLEEMLRLHGCIRHLRAQPSSLENFINVTLLDIRKARTNIGELREEEHEEYANDAERAMSAEQLMATGLQQLEEQEVQAALHFLRLAALHYDHEQSVIILHSIYAQLGSPRGPFLLLKRALNDEKLSAMANLKLGEQFDAGARHFLPMFPAAMYFYQRAAQAGSVHAMLAIAQLYLRGATTTTMSSEKQMATLRSVGKYHAWLKEAADRGCGSAYFVQASMYLKGEHGCSKSYPMAKDLLERATAAQPEIARRAPQVYMMLEKLRQENEAAAPAATDGALAKVSQSGTKDEDADKVQVATSIDRLNNLASRKPAGRGPGGMLGAKKMGNRSGGAKAFWERGVTTGLALYCLYTVAFPLRIVILPHFYTILGHLVDRIPWLSASPPTMQF